MTRKTRYPKISKIFAIGIILMLVTGCYEDDSPFYDPHQKPPWWISSKIKDHRNERLLKELLIETKETNTLLKNIERLLELDKGTKNGMQEELSDENSYAYNNWSEELEVRK